MTGKATIYVIDDDEAVRASLQWLLDSTGLFVRTFSIAQTFLDELDHQAEDPLGCVLVDLRLPGMSGLELLEQLKGRPANLPVIMITGHGDVPVAVRAMQAGAFDFIEKPFDEQYLLNRVGEALRCGADQRRTTADRAELQSRLEQLSPRERQVMNLVANGWLNKQIATELGLSHKTVEVHRACHGQNGSGQLRRTGAHGRGLGMNRVFGGRPDPVIGISLIPSGFAFCHTSSRHTTGAATRLTGPAVTGAKPARPMAQHGGTPSVVFLRAHRTAACALLMVIASTVPISAGAPSIPAGVKVSSFRFCAGLRLGRQGSS